MMTLAHSEGAEGVGHELLDHLREVAMLTRRFARRMRPEDEALAAMAEWAGWLDDLGKDFEDVCDSIARKKRCPRDAHPMQVHRVGTLGTIPQADTVSIRVGSPIRRGDDLPS